MAALEGAYTKLTPPTGYQSTEETNETGFEQDYGTSM